MAKALLAVLLWLGTANAAPSAWCSEGVHELDLDDSLPVVVHHAEAPLLSNSPSVGKKLGYLGIFHTCLVFSQGATAESQRYWTLEFDAANPASVLGAMLPEVNGTRLVWRNHARWCLTKGILWGRGHWSHAFTAVATATAKGIQRIFRNFMADPEEGGNTTTAPDGGGARPTYNLFRVDQHSWWPWTKERTLISDVTCVEGPHWFLNWGATTGSLTLTQLNFVMRGTTVILHADRVEPVDTSDLAAWADVVAYYSRQVAVFEAGSAWERIRRIFRAVPVRYVYDGNAAGGKGVYYRLHGNRFPFVTFKYKAQPLHPPPWHQKPMVASEGATIAV